MEPYEQLYQAMLDKNPLEMQLAMLRFGTETEAEQAVVRALVCLPRSIVYWWQSDACDLSHDGSDAIALVERVIEEIQAGRL